MKEQTALEPINRQTCVVKGTNRANGRTISVEPGKTASRNLYYGRIILNSSDEVITFETAERETGLVCLNGSASVSTGNLEFSLV